MAGSRSPAKTPANLRRLCVCCLERAKRSHCCSCLKIFIGLIQKRSFSTALVESLPTARLLLLVNYRPEYQHSWARPSILNFGLIRCPRKAPKNCSRACYETIRAFKASNTLD